MLCHGVYSPLIGESGSPKRAWQENEPFLYSRMTGENSLYDYYCNGLSGCRQQLVFPANSLHANRLFYPLVSLNVYSSGSQLVCRDLKMCRTANVKGLMSVVLICLSLGRRSFSAHLVEMFYVNSGFDLMINSSVRWAISQNMERFESLHAIHFLLKIKRSLWKISWI